MKKDFSELIEKLTLEEKALLLTGEDMATKAMPKYGIESISIADGPAGVRTPWDDTMEGGDVAFPTATAQAATWNRDMVRKVGIGLGKNCVAHRIDLLLGPSINMHRTPLCGRNYEFFSEDPYLTGELAVEYIGGVHSEGVGTSLKQFAVYSQQYFRGVVNAEIDERTLREHYLCAFETAVKRSNPTTVMCAYNKINGHYCSENKKLLTKILRNEWKYDGPIISDWGAVHNLGKAISAGLDLDMPQDMDIVEKLKEALEHDLVTMEDVNRALGNILNLVDRVKSMPRSKEPYNRAAMHQIAKEVADEAMVLLKNEDNILPLKVNQYKTIGVLGYFAEHPNVYTGVGSSGSVTVHDESIDSALDYIRRNAGEQTEVIYEPVYSELEGPVDFATMIKIQEVAKQSDVVIMFIGYHKYYEVEGEDRDKLEFPWHIARMAQEACRFSENTIIVMQTGSAVAPFMKFESPKALIQMWYAGEAAGHSIADILFGKVNPSGKLPVTFMKKLDESLDYPGDGRKLNYNEKMFVGYRYYDKHPDMVWYPFGYGLSYTSFEYSDLQITPEKSEDPNQVVTVCMKVKNIGKVAGKEAVQLYVSTRDGSVVRPMKDLKGFDKVELLPGETKQLKFSLDSRAFAYYNLNLEDWHVESGIYDILIGASSSDIRLNGSYEVNWEKDYTINRDRWNDFARRELVGGDDL